MNQSDPKDTRPFEESLRELEAIVSQLQSGQLPLDQGLTAFERGVALFRHCQTLLDQAELKVRRLTDINDPESAQDFDVNAS